VIFEGTTSEPVRYVDIGGTIEGLSEEDLAFAKSMGARLSKQSEQSEQEQREVQQQEQAAGSGNDPAPMDQPAAKSQGRR